LSNRLCYVHCERLSLGSHLGRIAADTAVTRRSVNLRLVPEQPGENPDAERTGGSREPTLTPETGGALKGAGSDREIRSPSGLPYGRSELRPPVGASLEGIEPRGAGQVRACPSTTAAFRSCRPGHTGRLGWEPLPPGEVSSRPDRPGINSRCRRTGSTFVGNPHWVERPVGIAGTPGMKTGGGYRSQRASQVAQSSALVWSE
jgi:hypothetical protein